MPAKLDDAEEKELEKPGISKEFFAQKLRDLVGKAREKVMPKLEEKIEKKTEKASNRIATGLGIFSLFGILLLGLPLVYAKKYPGQGATLFKYSALAAGVFFVAVNLFAVILIVMTQAKGLVAHQTDPSIAIFNAALDTMDDKADKMIEFGGAVIKPTLDQLASGDSDDPMPVALIDNLARAAKSGKELIPTLKSIATFAKDAMWITEYVPIILTMVTVLLFILGARPMLKEIIEIPARAARGEAGVAKAALKSVMTRVWREFLVTLVLAVILFVLTIVAGIAMRIAVRPAVEALIDYLLATALYIQQPNASGTILLASLGGSIFFIVLNVAAVVVASSLFLGKMQKVLQSIFHKQTTAADHKRFWRWSVPAVLLAFFIPVVWVSLAYALVDGPVKGAFSNGDEITNWDGFMFSGPLFFVVGFLVFFWAARGIKACAFLMKYKAVPVVSPAAPQQADTQQHAPNAPVSFRPPAADMLQAAKEFDDGAATVLVAKAQVPSAPRATTIPPKFTYRGERFGLGHVDEAFGIWYLHQDREAVQLFPRTSEGWTTAWTEFARLEPRSAKVD